MPTLTGSWQGSPYRARIKLVYTRTLTSNATQVQFKGEWFIEFEGSVVDSVNSWALTGDQPDKSGINRSYNVPSGGGQVNFADMGAFNRGPNNPTVTGRVSGIDIVGGGNITATFELPVGDLAPYFTDGSCSASSVAQTTATVGGWAATGNGGTLNNVQTQYNTAPSPTGAISATRDSYGTSMNLSGLTPNTTYYYRVRVANNTYGWGAYTTWFSFKTGAGLPGAPSSAWSISPNATGFTIKGNSVSNNGGSPITGWNVYYNDSPTLTGATTVSGSHPTVAPEVSGVPAALYYVAIAAKNANGVGTLSAWKPVTLLPGAFVKVDGLWKPAAIYIKVDGVWQLAVKYVKANGTWKA